MSRRASQDSPRPIPKRKPAPKIDGKEYDVGGQGTSNSSAPGADATISKAVALTASWPRPASPMYSSGPSFQATPGWQLSGPASSSKARDATVGGQSPPTASPTSKWGAGRTRTNSISVPPDSTIGRRSTSTTGAGERQSLPVPSGLTVPSSPSPKLEANDPSASQLTLIRTSQDCSPLPSPVTSIAAEKRREINMEDKDLTITPKRWSQSKHGKAEKAVVAAPAVQGESAASKTNDIRDDAFASDFHALSFLREDVGLFRVNSEPSRAVVHDYHLDEPRTIEPLHKMWDAVTQAGEILEKNEERSNTKGNRKGARFWVTVFAVIISTFVSALDMTVMIPALPSVAAEVPSTTISSIWITSSYLLAAACFQPLFGGCTGIAGHRLTLVLALLCSIAGSIVCATAKSALVLVIGRGVQGIGGGGLQALCQIILAEITTEHESDIYSGLLSITFAVATVVAPLLGGWFVSFNWRVIFFVDIPLLALALLSACFVKIDKPRISIKVRTMTLDFGAFVVLLGSATSLLIGLTDGGVLHSWASYRILVPVVVGGAGLFAALLYTVIRLWTSSRTGPRQEPSTRLPQCAKSVICCLLALLHGFIFFGAAQLLVLYFESVKSVTPFRAAVNILPLSAPSILSAMVFSTIMTVTKWSRSPLLVAEGLLVLGVGLFYRFDADTATVDWVLVQIVASVGIGGVYSLVQATIRTITPSGQQPKSMVAFTFSRTLGALWGFATVLVTSQCHINQPLQIIASAQNTGSLNGQSAIRFAASLDNFPSDAQTELRNAFARSIRLAVLVLLSFAAFGFVTAFFIGRGSPEDNEERAAREGQMQASDDLEKQMPVPTARDRAPSSASTVHENAASPSKKNLDTDEKALPQPMSFQLPSAFKLSDRKDSYVEPAGAGEGDRQLSVSTDATRVPLRGSFASGKSLPPEPESPATTIFVPPRRSSMILNDLLTAMLEHREEAMSMQRIASQTHEVTSQREREAAASRAENLTYSRSRSFSVT